MRAGARTAAGPPPGVAGERLDVAALLGVDALPPACRARAESLDLSYRVLHGAARDAALLDAVRALDAGLPVSGPARLPDWERGWAEILARFEASGGDPAALVPQYFLERQGVMRLGGEYVRPGSPAFQRNVVAVLQAWVAETWLADAGAVWEFGCGPGHNLVAFAELLPGRRFVGLDWAAPSQALLARIAARRGIDVRGVRCDLFAPDASARPEPGAAVVTVGALEQLGERWAPFLDLVLAARPAIVVHLEPLHELYDPTSLLDWLAARYAEKRNYLRGYLPRLRRLAREARIELLRVRRLLGNLHHDGWGLCVWRPRPGSGRG